MLTRHLFDRRVLAPAAHPPLCLEEAPERGSGMLAPDVNKLIAFQKHKLRYCGVWGISRIGLYPCETGAGFCPSRLRQSAILEMARKSVKLHRNCWSGAQNWHCVRPHQMFATNRDLSNCCGRLRDRKGVLESMAVGPLAGQDSYFFR